MIHIRNNRGIAMVMVLILSAIVLSLTAAVIYLITQGTIMSGSQSRYSTALEAGYGGLDFFERFIENRGVLVLTPDFPVNLDSSVDTCLDDKLNVDKLDTDLTILWANCLLPDCSGTPCRWTDDPVQAADMNLTLGNYNVNVKLVETSTGNSNTSTLDLGGAGVVNQSSGLITPPPVPYLYRINIRAQNNQTQERADISAVYAY